MEEYKNFFLNDMYDSSIELYQNVYLHTGSNIKLEWNSCLAYSNKIIKNSNSFIGDYFSYTDFYREFQNNTYKIFDNLHKNYNEILKINNENNNFENIFNDNETYFLMINPFTFKNYGHDFSVILDQINYIINNDIKNIIMYEDYDKNNNFKLVKCLFPSYCNFYYIKYEKIYYIKNLIIKNQIIANIYLHENLINNIIAYITNNYINEYKDCINKNIILMKTNRNNSYFVEHTKHNCESFLTELEKQSWINIIPEKMCIYKMVILLNNAKNIITSEGCISFLNHIFFNKKANIIYIGKNKLYISITKRNSNGYCYINDIMNDNSNKYLEYINLINTKINNESICSHIGVKCRGLSNILENKDVITIKECNYFYYSNITDFIESHKLLHAHCFISENILYIPDIEFNFYVNNFIKNHETVLIKNDIEPIFLEEAYILFHTYDNAGHTLGLILYGILKFIQGKFNCKVIISKSLLNLSTFIKSIIYIFLNEDDIILIDENTNYYIKNCFVNNNGYKYHVINKISSYFYDDISNTSECIINYDDMETNHSDELNLLINKLKIFDNLVFKQDCFKKICLIKLDSDANFSKNRHFDNSYKHFFINKGFEIIDPSSLTVKELYLLLKNTKQAVMSWGCNFWINRLFVENRTHVIILCHKGYNHEYECIKKNTDLHFSPTCIRTTYVYDLDDSLNETNFSLLNKLID